MAENPELEDLDQLVNSAGWRRFTDMVEQQWGRGGDRFIDAVTNAAKGENQHAQDHLRQIIAAQREIQAVMALVPNRVKLLKGSEQPQLVGASRRGGL